MIRDSFNKWNKKGRNGGREQLRRKWRGKKKSRIDILK